MGRRPVVLGGAIAPFGNHRDGSHWRDRVRLVAAQALAQSALDAHDIDALVVATESDAMSMQINAAAVVASDLGLEHCSVMRVEGGGASGGLALRAGMMHVLSGMAARVLVVGFDDAASRLKGADTRLLYALSFDSDVEGFAGATAASLYALSISGHMRRHGTTEAQMAAVSVKNRGNARFNPCAHKPMEVSIDDVLRSPEVSSPYKLLDCSLLSDGAAAIVLGAPGEIPDTQRVRVRISGSGCAADRARLGDRADPYRFAAKSLAARRAYAMAGITDAMQEIDVAEVYDAFSGAELQSLEALGLAAEGQAAKACAARSFDRDGRLPVNLSGGLMGQGGAPGAVGIAQAVTVWRLLSGDYHPGLQPKRALRRGVIDAHGGVATVCVVHVLECEDA
ncbi:MAG: thiolase family protein [Caldimonas sp.]